MRNFVACHGEQQQRDAFKTINVRNFKSLRIGGIMDENSVSEPAQRTIEEFESENRPSYQDTLPDTWMVSAGSYDSIADKWAKSHDSL